MNAQQRFADIDRWLKAGVTYKQIGRVYGVTGSAIHAWRARVLSNRYTAKLMGLPETWPARTVNAILSEVKGKIEISPESVRQYLLDKRSGKRAGLWFIPHLGKNGVALIDNWLDTLYR